MEKIEKIYKGIREEAENLKELEAATERSVARFSGMLKTLKSEGVDIPPWVKKIKLPPVKGKSGFSVVTSYLPSYYLLIEHSKRRNDRGEVEEIRTRVYPEEYQRIRDVVANIKETHFPDKKIPGTVATELICKKAKLRRYFIDGVFNSDMFYGDRDKYFKYYYYPLKVLQHYGFIDHTAQGFIIKNPKKKW